MADALTTTPELSPEEAARLLSGTQKCAILMLLLGEDEASEILKNLSPREVQQLGSAMYSVADVDQQTVNVVLDEFLSIIKAQTYTSTRFYSMTTGIIELVPPAVDDITIDMVYYGKIPALSDANTTNWLLTKAPDVYLYGALTHAAPFLMDDQRMAVFSQIYLARVQSLQDESQKSLHSGSPLISRPRGVYG
jgi:hypothetical protein